MILQVILACVICFAITAVAGKLLIPELVKLKAGQSIKEIGPTWRRGTLPISMYTCLPWYSASSAILMTIRR